MRNPRAKALLLILPLTLTSCASLTSILGLGIQTPPAKASEQDGARAVACSEFSAISINKGKPGLTVGDVQEQAARTDDPIGHVRNYVGDTSQTIAEVTIHNAIFDRICKPPK